MTAPRLPEAFANLTENMTMGLDWNEAGDEATVCIVRHNPDNTIYVFFVGKLVAAEVIETRVMPAAPA